MSALIPGRGRAWLLPVVDGATPPSVEEIRATGVEVELVPALPDLVSVHTYASGPSSNPPLCLAVRHEPGDPMPMICARAVHLPDDPRHLTYHYGNYEQTTWTEED